ncbi:hypothetical protein SDC9_07463 [bioreactor metagenome]|uniref:Uncharacterized protein n=1 Tax=bioreactor metagenome TaxID=1076179 RepID=A0A644T4Y4_9ZZZZ|nr:hypothetical protein [Methanobrevibacter sp.]MEA4956918.1 hypothetical protein [Methanobrevibacter sp.]
MGVPAPIKNKNAITKQLKDKDVKDIVNHINGDFFNVGGGKRIPDSRVVQSLANQAKIKTDTINIKQNSEEATVTVRAVAPNGASIDASVTHNFEVVMQDKIMSMLASNQANKLFIDINNPFMMDNSGNITPNLTLLGQKKIVKDMIQFKKFAVRDAETKADNRAQKKILNQEWREEDEIKSEKEEVEMVNKGKKVTTEPIKSPEPPNNNHVNVEYTKKQSKKEQTEDMVASDWLEKIKEDLKSKGKAADKPLIEAKCNGLVKNDDSFDESMKSRVLALI